MLNLELDEATLLGEALDRARALGARYAEARLVSTRLEEIGVRNGLVDRLQSSADHGWGLTLYVGDGLGFASSAEISPPSVNRVVATALELARASATVRRTRVDLASVSTAQGVYTALFQRDPFTVPLEEKLDLLRLCCANLARPARVRVSQSTFFAEETQKLYLNTAGARQQQHLLFTGGGLSAVAVDGGYSYTRTYGRGGNYHQAGYEYLERLDLPTHALRVGPEAHDLVTAPWAPEGPTPAVLGTNMMALITHESCGHPTELDRVIGWEAAFAGTSFLDPEQRGRFAYGSPHANLSADAHTHEGLGTFGWDDEGVAAQSTPLVQEGIFTGFMSSRDSAAALGLKSSGAARASGWGRLPIVRMTNVNLQPGHGTFDDLLAEMGEGLYLETPSSWSLDDKRMNFNFSAELCRQVKGGKLGALYKGATFQERTPTFWGRCESVAGPSEWELWGFLSCAKGEPLQLARVSHGASPALISRLQVGRGS